MTIPPDHARARLLLACVLGLLLVAVPFTAAGAAPVVLQGPTPGYTKYYVVPASAAGKPERLRDVAAQFLGDGNRSAEVFALNSGRQQSDGGALTESGVLHPGWLLILPWDAAGDGVSYGILPSSPPTPGTGGPSPAHTVAPSPLAAACAPPGPDAAPPSGTTAGVPWAQLRLAPDNAWVRSRGRGATVAVVDSGVDAAAPALAGRVLAGSSTVPGGAGGDHDCVGHGTAIAGIIAAQKQPGNAFVGMAPEATILPIRVASGSTGDAAARAREVASAIRLAVSGGARVIAVTAEVDLAQVDASLAIDVAIAQDVAVVVPAATHTRSPADRPGLLRVGAAGADDSPADSYLAGNVDVLAPGVRVTSIGLAGTAAVEGTGADFAVPFVAGLLALIRSAYPDRSAVSAVQTVEASAGHGAAASPDPVSGWGFIDPTAAVGAAPAGGASKSGNGSSRGTEVALLLVVVLGLGALTAGFHLRAGAGRRRR